MVPGLFSLVPVDTRPEQEYLPPAYLWRQAERTVVDNRIVLSQQAVIGMSEAQINNRLLLMAQKAGWEHPERGTVVRRSDTMEIEYYERGSWSGYFIDGPLKGSSRVHTQDTLEVITSLFGPNKGSTVTYQHRTVTYQHRTVWVNQVPYDAWVCGGTNAIHVWHTEAWAVAYWLNLVPLGRWQVFEPEETYVDVDVEVLIDRWVAAHA